MVHPLQNQEDGASVLASMRSAAEATVDVLEDLIGAVEDFAETMEDSDLGDD